MWSGWCRLRCMFSCCPCTSLPHQHHIQNLLCRSSLESIFRDVSITIKGRTSHLFCWRVCSIEATVDRCRFGCTPKSASLKERSWFTAWSMSVTQITLLLQQTCLLYSMFKNKINPKTSPLFSLVTRLKSSLKSKITTSLQAFNWNCIQLCLEWLLFPFYLHRRAYVSICSVGLLVGCLVGLSAGWHNTHWLNLIGGMYRWVKQILCRSRSAEL